MSRDAGFHFLSVSSVTHDPHSTRMNTTGSHVGSIKNLDSNGWGICFHMTNADIPTLSHGLCSDPVDIPFTDEKPEVVLKARLYPRLKRTFPFLYEIQPLVGNPGPSGFRGSHYNLLSFPCYSLQNCAR